MSDLRLSLAISDYVHTRDVADGRIKPVGVDSTIEPFLAYCDEQGVTQRLLTAEELFPKEVAFEVKI